MAAKQSAASSSSSANVKKPAVKAKELSASFDDPVIARKAPSRASQYAKPAALWLLLIPYCIFLARWTLQQHCQSSCSTASCQLRSRLNPKLRPPYTDALPTPLSSAHDDAGLPQFSEVRALEYVRHCQYPSVINARTTSHTGETLSQTQKILAIGYWGHRRWKRRSNIR